MSDAERSVEIPAGPVRLCADIIIPHQATRLVVFAHGSGSSRHSPRNRYVANILHQARLATLLTDLLTIEEEALDRNTAHLRFNIRLLADRLVSVTDWLAREPGTNRLRIGYFGASTGAAAALVAAATRSALVGAVVSRGGRPDLASLALPSVKAPTLLIVGGNDVPVLAMNREAMSQLQCQTRLEIIPGASHLFEEPSALDKVALLASQWFLKHLVVE